MNKLEVKRILKQRRKQGYVTHEMILDIYNDDEELPENILDLVSQKIEPRRITLMTSFEGTKLLEEILNEKAHQYLKCSSNT